MAHSTGNYTLVRRIKDPQFSVDRLDQYALLLLAGTHNFQFCVVDTDQQRCLLLEDYSFSDTLEELTGAYRTIIEEHQLLMAGYWKSVKLAVKSPYFTLVPRSYFSPENPGHYLKLAVALPEENYSISYQMHEQAEAAMVFGANKGLVDRIKSTYPSQDIPLKYQGSVFIEGIRQMPSGSHYPVMHLHIDQGALTVLVIDNGNVVFYNNFAYQSPDDVVKYTLTAFQKLSLDQNDTKVVVWGNIPLKSDEYAALYRYIRQLTLGTKPDFLTFSHMFDEAPDHQYFDLYSLYLTP
ncbi:DUF3822 family protein [Tunicatimonas pelagia]|uniref:DUF3822 family protein n=1 Tax=Tunicatimonas pelagia TaxID=931531 RepID=UPI002665B281|nr:DUF3822 family protein [Tunicatimonas pelagia]WKN45924.1 DUF3822 family protein [Tunicatimonas pelagia]